MEPQKNEGFVIPLHRSLTERQLMGGAPSTAVILNGTITLAAAMAFSSVWVIPFGFVVQLALASICRQDPEFIEIFVIYLKQATRLRA